MGDESNKIVLAGAFDGVAVNAAQDLGDVEVVRDPTAAELRRAVADCHALIVRSWVPVDESILTAAPKLRVIGRAGVGFENVDIECAKARGVTVCYTPAASTDAVADLTVGLMIAVLRNIVHSDRAVRSGRFYEARKDSTGPELHNLTIGIIGLGRIGKAVARRCQQGFHMRVIYHDVVEMDALDFDASPRPQDGIYQESDVISLHVPLTLQTRGLIDSDSLARFRRGAVLINTSRGAVVDTAALTDALISGGLAGAGLDVVHPEPLPAGHPLLARPHTVLTPHIGARTVLALLRMQAVVEDVGRVLQGQEPLHAIP